MFEMVKVPLAAVLPPTPEMVTCSPALSTPVLVVVIVIGDVLLAPVILAFRPTLVAGVGAEATELQVFVSGL